MNNAERILQISNILHRSKVSMKEFEKNSFKDKEVRKRDIFLILCINIPCYKGGDANKYEK